MSELKIECENWTRVVGYLRPVSSMHAAKQLEVHDRVPFAWPAAGKEEEDATSAVPVLRR